MNTNYKKEKKKVLFLIGIGLILLFLFLLSVIQQYGFSDVIRDIFSFESIFIILMILFYPLGIVYGWRRILDIALFIPRDGPPDRYYTVAERNNYKSMKMSAFFMKLGLVVLFGWIFGTINAFKRLYYLRKAE